RYERIRSRYRLDTNELPSVLASIVRTHERASADEVADLVVDDAGKAQIERIGRAVGIRPHVQETFLQSQDQPRLDADRRDAKLLPAGHELLPQPLGLVGRNTDLVAQLAGEADALHANRPARELTA